MEEEEERVELPIKQHIVAPPLVIKQQVQTDNVDKEVIVSRSDRVESPTNVRPKLE